MGTRPVVVPVTAQKVIGSIVCTPPNPQVGESVLVEVKSPEGKTYTDTDPVRISINGLPGARQWLQWAKAGNKAVFVMAKRTALLLAGSDRPPIERQVAKVQVKKPTAGSPALPVLQVIRATAQPNRVSFHLDGWTPKPPDRPVVATTRPKITLQPKTSGATRAASKNARIAVDVAETQQLRWNFGEGTNVSVMRTQISHDFTPKMDRDRVWESFDVSVTYSKHDGTTGVARRTVHVVNHYAAAKGKGFILPPVYGGLTASFYNDQFRGSLTIQNVEDEELHLTSRRILPIVEEGSAPSLLPVEAADIRIPARSSKTIFVMVASDKLPKSAVGFTAYFGGVLQSRNIRVAGHFEIPSRQARKYVPVAAATEALLDSLVRDKLVANPTSITLNELEDLASRNLVEIPRTGPALKRLQAVRPKINFGKVMAKKAMPIIEGGECDPDNVPDFVPEGFVCQATAETRWQPMPGRFMNARKGDVVLSPTGDTLIGNLLREVDPPQMHAHSGIMTRNYDQITHSTASEDRLLDYPNGSVAGTPAPTDGHRPDVLKYLWPGVITQTVEDSVHGEDFKDPESGKMYNISGFDPDRAKIDTGVAEEVAMPLVVKPDPFGETPDIRLKLHKIADFAESKTGKSHYRFFCYTDPTIGLTDKAPASAGWAKDTFPTVCSSLVWMSVKQSGALMEGATIEPKDITGGAERAASTQDGLYLYRADERRAAGELMYNMLCQMVDQKLADQGLLGEIAGFFSDMADDVANQILNTFATDWAAEDAKDSEAWKNTVDASAVAPDNIMFWDAPATQGLYGFFEPLVYRAPRYEKVTVHKWRKVATRGTLTGKVTFNNAAVAQANVQVYDGKFTFTDANGKFTLSQVPEGNYVMKVLKVRDDGTPLSAEKNVTIAPGGTTTTNISLSLPDDMYRQAEIDVDMYIKDYEFAAAADPQNSKSFFKVLRVGPYGTHDETVTKCIADDVHGMAIIKADWNLDKSITITLIGRLYDGSWDADDVEYEASPKVFKVNPGGTGGWHLRITDDDDVVDIQMSVKNVVQNS